jgi:hypothetical protein
MKTLILTTILFISSSVIELYYNAINVYRLLNDQNELYYAENMDTKGIEPIVAEEFDIDDRYLKDADSVKIVYDSVFYVYLK